MKLLNTRYLILAALALICITVFVYASRSQRAEDTLSLTEYAAKAKVYVSKHGLNTNYAILIDYGIPSGYPRLFVWDFNKGKVVAKFHVMHGSGGGSTAKNPVFSNQPGSACSSLGKFMITRSHGYKLKRSFRVKGLEDTNDNAWRRGIMLHRSTWVDRHRWRKYIPLHDISCQGCITVSSKGMKYLERLIKKEKAPILLWSWYDEIQDLKLVSFAEI